MSVIQISAKELQLKLQVAKKPLLVDVREQNEVNFAQIKGSLHIPMNQVADRIKEIDSQSGCVVICHHGLRSQQVAAYLVHAGLSNIYNLTGGIDAWSLQCDHTVSRY